MADETTPPDLCEGCGMSLKHGVDMYCATKGCPEELTLANVVKDYQAKHTKTEECVRCKVLEDLLETATSERDKARDEAAKADREALSLKDRVSQARYENHHSDRELVAYFRAVARELGATPEQMLER